MWRKSLSLQMLNIFIFLSLIDSLKEYSRLKSILSQNLKTWLHFFSKRSHILDHYSALTIATISLVYIFQKFIKISYFLMPSLFFSLWFCGFKNVYSSFILGRVLGKKINICDNPQSLFKSKNFIFLLPK